MSAEMTADAAPPADAPTEPAAAPLTAPAPPADPKAPWGRTPSGRARSKPLSGRRGRPRGSRTSVIGAKGSRVKSAAKPAAPDYRPTVIRTVQMLTLPLAFRQPVDAWCINAAVVGDDSAENPGIARAVSDLAGDYPQVAAVLDKVAAAGPLSDLIGATIPLVVQLLVNHGRLPLSVGEKLGAADPELIAKGLQAQGETLAQAA